MSVSTFANEGDVIEWTWKNETHLSKVQGHCLLPKSKSLEDSRDWSTHIKGYLVFMLITDDEEHPEPYWDDIPVHPNYVIAVYRKHQ